MPFSRTPLGSVSVRLLAAGLLVSPLAAHAAPYTWSGATSTNWSVDTNWQGGSAPANSETGIELTFPNDPSSRTSNNDRSSLSLNSVNITTANTGAHYVFTGNGINLNGDMSFGNPGSGSVYPQWSIPLTLTADAEITTSGRQTQMLGSINLNSHDLTWAASGDVSVSGPITGSGNVVKIGSSALTLSGDSTFAGTFSCNAGMLAIAHDSALGTTANGTTLSNTCTLSLNGGNRNIDEPLTFNGSHNLNGYFASTLNGPITLNGSVNVAVWGSSLTINGAIGGNGSLSKNSQVGTLILNGTNGYSGTTTVGAGTLRVNGSIANSAVTVNSGGTLGGGGTTGAVTVNNGGTIAPGLSPGIINTGSFNLTAGGTYIAELDGPTVGTEYDQIDVTGSVTLAGTLEVWLGYIPAPGTQFVIINNDGNDPVNGTFAGLAEGDWLIANGETLFITYQGGDGNDVVLSTLAEAVDTPGPTGWILLPLASLLLLVGSRAGRRRGSC